jgi:hypothetical protein
MADTLDSRFASKQQEIIDFIQSALKDQRLDSTVFTKDHLMFFLLGTSRSSLIPMEAVKSLHMLTEERDIFTKLLKVMISISHGNTHNTATKLTVDGLANISSMTCADISEVCVIVADSCKLFFNATAEDLWMEASHFPPFSADTAIQMMEWFHSVECELIRRINALEPEEAAAITIPEINCRMASSFGCSDTFFSVNKKDLPKTPSAVYTKPNDSIFYISVDVVKSNWTAIKILYKLISDSDIGEYEELVASVLEIKYPFISSLFVDDSRWPDFMKAICLKSKLLRSRALNKSTGNSKKSSHIVQSIISLVYNKLNHINHEPVVLAYDEMIYKVNGAMNRESLLELENQIKEELGFLQGIVRVEIYQVRAIVSEASRKFLGVCRVFLDGSKDFKCVDPAHLNQAHQLSLSF